MRMKKRPSLLECWSASMMLSSASARKPLTAAINPGRSGQASSRRVVGVAAIGGSWLNLLAYADHGSAGQPDGADRVEAEPGADADRRGDVRDAGRPLAAGRPAHRDACGFGRG